MKKLQSMRIRLARRSITAAAVAVLLALSGTTEARVSDTQYLEKGKGAEIPRQLVGVYESPIDGQVFAAEHGYFSPAGASQVGRDAAVAYLRIRRAGGPSSEPPVFILSGGPGHNAIDRFEAAYLTDTKGFSRLADVLTRRDVVVLDQRGTTPSLSDPNLRCLPAWTAPLDQPWQTRVDYVAAMRGHAASCRAQLTGAGIDLAAYSADAVADDVDTLRELLGYDQIVLYGISAGGMGSSAYLARYPDRIARAVLVVPATPGSEYSLPSQYDAMFERVAVEERRRSGRDLRGETEGLIAALRRMPVATTGTANSRRYAIKLGAYDLQFAITWSLFELGEARKLPAAVARMRGGDFGWLADTMIPWRLGRSGSMVAGKAAGQAMMCATPIPPSRARQLARETATHWLGGEAGWGALPELCDQWRVPQHPLRPTATRAPVLFVLGALDPIYAKVDIVEKLKTYHNAAAVVLPNSGHGDGTTNPTAMDVVVAALSGAAPVEVAGNVRYLADE